MSEDVDSRIKELEGKIQALEYESLFTSDKQDESGEGFLRVGKMGRLQVEDFDIEFLPDTEDESQWAFGTLLNDNEVTVYSGWIIYHDQKAEEVAETTVTLSALTEYVYVQWQRLSADSGSIEHSATFPTSSGATMKWVLASFTLTDGAYQKDKSYYRNNINLDLPLRT